MNDNHAKAIFLETSEIGGLVPWGAGLGLGGDQIQCLQKAVFCYVFQVTGGSRIGSIYTWTTLNRHFVDHLVDVRKICRHKRNVDDAA